MWPRDNPIRIHLNTDDAKLIIDEAQPKACILTHFGMRMLNAGPEKEAEYLTAETGVPVFAATDGLKVSLEDEITLKGPRKKDEPIVVDV
jgi:phosphoribosyl 1,2-cyclic phosphodiesterase